jgi:16S rRNA (guanine527-N7)-methyltransferase
VIPIDKPDSGLLEKLQSGAAQLGLPLTALQSDQLLKYLSCLERWSTVHNLSAVAEQPAALVRHVFDSMTLVEPLARYAAGKFQRVFDAGSGAGFPAAIIAVMQPTWFVMAADSVAKKIAFIRQASHYAHIENLVAIHKRVKDIRDQEGFDIIVSRAFNSLNSLVLQTAHLLAPNGIWVAQKGQVPSHEIAHLDANCEVFHVEPVIVPALIGNRCLVWMRKASQ